MTTLPRRRPRNATFWVAALCVVMLLTGCDSPVRLMPTPLSFRSGDVDPFAKAGYLGQGTDLPVFYVTNRGAVIEKPEPIHTLLPSERLRIGVAHMRIGDDTLDWETLHRLSTSDDPDAQVYFAAPDIDTRRFADERAQYIDIVGRVSIAANLSDSALRFSAVVKRGSRAGSANPAELSEEQTDFRVDASRKLGFDIIKVDPTAIPKLPPRSHAFWFEDPWVSGDLLGLLLLNAKPQRRGLEPLENPQGTRYRTFPPDFKDRVHRLFTPASAASSPG